jgi:NAD(P)-dependent dehydrogenase (short-subunit alcohol dehydrogenase family)
MEEHINKIALITGANKGIGLDIARQLGAKGVTVIVGARDAGRGQAAVDLLRSENLNAQHYASSADNPGAAWPPGYSRQQRRYR